MTTTIKEQFKKHYVDAAAPGTEGQRILSQMHQSYEELEQELSTKKDLEKQLEAKNAEIAKLKEASKTKTSTRKTTAKTEAKTV